MKRVIAFYSFPQECGDDSLRFVNCEDGQVILDICLTMQAEPWEKKITRTPISEEKVFYDECIRQRFSIGDVDDFSTTAGLRSKREPGSYLDDGFWEKHAKDTICVLDVECLEELPKTEVDKLILGDRKLYLWKYTVVAADVKKEYIYHPEWDSVYIEIQKKTGLEMTAADRSQMSYETLAAIIAETVGYELLNVLFG